MKYLFVIYTDLEYKKHLDHFKSQEFYKEICNDSNIEVIEWGDDFHTDYRDLPIKTQQMMKWCGENKEYDYLIKCDDTIFDDKWSFYRPKLNEFRVIKKKDYWGINYIGPHTDEVWKIYFDGHYGKNKIDYNLKFIKNDIQFYEGKFYMVSRDLSIFIGRQENFAKRMSESFPVEDLMVGYLAESF